MKTARCLYLTGSNRREEKVA